MKITSSTRVKAKFKHSIQWILGICWLSIIVRIPGDLSIAYAGDGTVPPAHIYLPTIIHPSETQIEKIYYISPTGNDSKSGTSAEEAWASFERAWQDLYPGDILVLLDGVYRQSLFPNKRNGEPGKPITIRAQNDGKAIIDGEYQRVPVQLGAWHGAEIGSYFVIEGIVAKNSSDQVYYIFGNHNVLRRVSGYNADNNKNSMVFTLDTAEYNLIEDCVAAGTGRKMVWSWGGGHNIIRRCFASWSQYDGREHCSEWPWGENLELYNSSNNIIENSISYGSVPKTGVSILGNINSANGDTPYTRNNQILGVIAIRSGINTDGTLRHWGDTRPKPTECDGISKLWKWSGWRLGFGVILWGEAAEVSNTKFQDIFSWGNAGLGFSEIHPFNESQHTVINRATVINNGLDVPPGDGDVGTDIILDQVSHMTISNSKIEGTQYQDEGAHFQFRYVDGQLMDGTEGRLAQSLWPWPMQDRILTELGIDVTGEIVAILQNANVPTGWNLPAPEINPIPPQTNIANDVGSATYLTSINVSLATSIPNAVIRYTLDGNEPNANSLQYTQTITISNSSILKAKTFLGRQASHTRSVYYRINLDDANAAPHVEASLLPFVYPVGRIMLPMNQILLYGNAEDFTLPAAFSKLATKWSVHNGPKGVVFSDSNSLKTTATFSQPGTYTLRLTASDGLMSTDADVVVTVLPEGGNVINLPGRVEAEDFNAGGEGIGYHDTSNGNYGQVYFQGSYGSIYRSDDVDLAWATNEDYGYSVNRIVPGEWTAYTVNITETSAYVLSVRVAGENPDRNGTFHVELDRSNISGPIAVPYTNSSSRKYITITRLTPLLSQGEHELRIVGDQTSAGGKELEISINYLDFSIP